MNRPHERGVAGEDLDVLLGAAQARRLTPLQHASIVAAACVLMLAAGCGSEDEQSTQTSAPLERQLEAAQVGRGAHGVSVPAEIKPSPDLASHVVQGDELLGFRLIGADEAQVQTDPEDFSARHQGLYAEPAEAVIAQRRDGFVAGTGKRFGLGQDEGLAESIAVQMRDAQGATAEAERQFSAAFAPCRGEPRCATAIERFQIPGVPGADAVEIRHKVDGDLLYTTAIVFTEDTLVHQIFAGGPRIDAQRDELIAAAQAIYKRVT